MGRREYPDSPRVGVGAIVITDGRVLLVKRGVAPSQGLWAIPGGLLELGETLQQGAEREIREETGIVIKAGEPVFTFDFFEWDQKGRLRFHYVIVDLAAEYVGGEVAGASDALEARWLTVEDLASLDVAKKTILALHKVGFIFPGEL
ncbi:MAG: NUDIX hydrolase [Smithellaceae bacterium]|nr:NUDIX hydrolase [Smithellaceae bacterium]